MTAENLTLGQEVILDFRSRYSDQPCWNGSVTKVGRRYATADFEGTRKWLGRDEAVTRTVEFDMATGYVKGDEHGNGWRVKTPAQAEREVRTIAAEKYLRSRRIDVMGARLTLEQLEAVADLVRSFHPDSSKEQDR